MNFKPGYALKVALIYLVCAGAYIFLSGILVQRAAASLSEMRGFETLKGIGFVVVTSVMLYFILRRQFERRDQAEKALHKHREMLDTITQTIPVGLAILNTEGEFTFVNRRGEEVLGAQVVGTGFRSQRTPEWRLMAADGQPLLPEQMPFWQVMAARQPRYATECLVEWPDGRRVLLSIDAAPLFDLAGELTGAVAAFQDITRQAAESQELRRLNRALRLLGECSRLAIQARDEAALTQQVCQEIVNTAGYRLAWVVFSVADAPGVLRLAACMGPQADQLAPIIEAWLVESSSARPEEEAIRSQITAIRADLTLAADFPAWQEAARRHGLVSSAHIPLVADNEQAFGALSVCASRANLFDADEVALLEKLAGSLAESILARRTRAAQQQAEAALQEQKSLLQTILDKAPVQIVSVDRQGAIRWVNRGWSETLGWTLDEAQEIDVLAACYPDPDVLRQVTDFIYRADGTWADFKVRRRDGKLLDMIWANVRLADDGRLGIGMDVTGYKRLVEDLRQSEDTVRSLSLRLVEAEEKERKRLAQELHDRVGQNLTALSIGLNVMRSLLLQQQVQPAMKWLDDAGELVGQTAGLIRGIMAELRPPVLDDYGLLTTLREYARRFMERTQIDVQVIGHEPAPPLSTAVAMTLLRITQEALNNVAKHAQARQVAVELQERAGRVYLVIQDNGVGFDVAAPVRETSWGLSIMSERATTIGARLRIESQPGQGTRLTVEISR
jgi:PAS domain S-box-containing protein